MKRKLESQENISKGDSDEDISSDFESDEEDNIELPPESQGMLLSELFDEFKAQGALKQKNIVSNESSVRNQHLFHEIMEQEDELSVENLEEVREVTDSDDEEDEDENEESLSPSHNSHSKLLDSINKFARTECIQKGESSREALSMHGLSLDTLMGNASGLGNQVLQIKSPVYVDKPALSRNEREVAYEMNKSNVDKWHKAVLSNRFVKTLDLAKDQRQFLRSRSLIQKFSPSTSFEKEMELITSSNGLNEQEIQRSEDLSLIGRSLSAEELKQRQQDLAKINTLLFYEQIKRHRINKIKSKAFRKSLRRKRSKGLNEIEAADSDHLERIEERASLRHKNTTSWAKMAISHSHDRSLREAYHEAVRKGNELTKKIQLDGFDSFEKENQTDDHRKELEELEQSAEKSETVDGKFSKLLKMDFMQRALLKQKEKLREEAVEVWNDLKFSHKSKLEFDLEQSPVHYSNNPSHDRANKDNLLITRSFHEISPVVNSGNLKTSRVDEVQQSLNTLEQDDLVALAFSGPDVESEFRGLKEQTVNDDCGVETKKIEILKDVKAGWGDWAGPGAQQISKSIMRKRDIALKRIQDDRNANASLRKDFKKQGVIISEKRIKSSAKFKVDDIPFPFKTREEYERSLQLPIGDEWNPSHIVKKLTAAEVKTRAGRIIQPIQRVEAGVTAKGHSMNKDWKKRKLN